MEIGSVRHIIKSAILTCFITAMLSVDAYSQKVYTVKNGKMYIELSKNLPEAVLDSFIRQFNLNDLALKEFIRTNFQDSIRKAGWNINENSKNLFVITKPLFGFDDINNPADKILFTGKDPSLAQMFPSVSQNLIFGNNRFRNKNPFAQQDSMITFYLRGNRNADKVILSGSFVNWSPTEIRMTRTDSGWVTNVKLKPGKYWYKFIVDGKWITDDDNLLRENDGMGNVNSVVYKTNHVFRFKPTKEAKKVYLTGSFNQWKEKELEMKKVGDNWELPLYLAEGTHTYRFIADGDWYSDEANPERLPNEFGYYNSVVRKGKPYIFKLDGQPDAKQVVLAGNFNGWRRDELFMTKTSTGWEVPYTIGPGNYSYKFFVDKKELTRENQVLIIQPNHTFRLTGFANASKVYLAGDFNGWDPRSLLMKRDGNDWIFTVHLYPGKHLYKFIIDGKWTIDPGNKLWEGNEHGTGNSVLWIEN